MQGARAGRSWSWAHPRPSKTRSTIWRAPVTDSGSQSTTWPARAARDPRPGWRCRGRRSPGAPARAARGAPGRVRWPLANPTRHRPGASAHRPVPPPGDRPAVAWVGVKVSTRGDYASRALLYLALHGAQTTPTSVRDIAERTGLPQPYLEQILLALKGAGLVRSKRGVGGGYVLARPPEEISLAQIVSAVDGPIIAGDFGAPTPAGPATTRVSACCWPCGPRSVSTCAGTSRRSRWPTWWTVAQRDPGHPRPRTGPGGHAPGHRGGGRLRPHRGRSFHVPDDRLLPFPTQRQSGPG